MGNEQGKGHHKEKSTASSQGTSKKDDTKDKAPEAQRKLPRFSADSHDPIDKLYDVTDKMLGKYDFLLLCGRGVAFVCCDTNFPLCPCVPALPSCPDPPLAAGATSRP